MSNPTDLFAWTVERIDREIAEHRSTAPEGQHGQCLHCMIPGWPCDRVQVLRLARQAEGYRAALKTLVAERPNCWGLVGDQRCGKCDWCVAEEALNG